jgi:hypothetical protein
MKVKLFATGFLHVMLVSISTYAISRALYGGVFVSGFLVSYIWSWNVKRIALSTPLDRVVYALGAACGSTAGVLLFRLLMP